jgi:hypothetical protein
VTCQLPLTPARLAARPDAVQCVKCVCLHGDEPALRGRMVYDHKTAPSIEIGTRLAANPPPRFGFGPSIRLDGYQTQQERRGAAGVLAFDAAAAIGAKARRDAAVELEPARLTHPARCHPDRPRIGPSGQCLDCAMAQQRKRVQYARAS